MGSLEGVLHFIQNMLGMLFSGSKEPPTPPPV